MMRGQGTKLPTHPVLILVPAVLLKRRSSRDMLDVCDRGKGEGMLNEPWRRSKGRIAMIR